MNLLGKLIRRKPVNPSPYPAAELHNRLQLGKSYPDQGAVAVGHNRNLGPAPNPIGLRAGREWRTPSPGANRIVPIPVDHFMEIEVTGKGTPVTLYKRDGRKRARIAVYRNMPATREAIRKVHGAGEYVAVRGRL